MDKKDGEKVQIRNSSTDFLVFTKQADSDGIEVRVHSESVWLTQKGMAQLFDCSTDNVGLHLKNIFASGELSESAVTEESLATAADGKTYRMKFYNLDAIISVGYRWKANSKSTGSYKIDCSKAISTDCLLKRKRITTTNKADRQCETNRVVKRFSGDAFVRSAFRVRSVFLLRRVLVCGA